MTTLDKIKKILTSVIDIIEFTSTIHKLIPILQSLNEDMKLIHELAPTLQSLNENVLKSYLKVCEDSKDIMKQMTKDLEDPEKQSLEDLDNINMEKMITLAKAFQLPVLGGMYRGQLNARRAMRYYHREKNAAPLNLYMVAAGGQADNKDNIMVRGYRHIFKD